MRRALCLTALIALSGSVWLARPSYSYFYSQALYPANWTNWWTQFQVSSSCYTPGGYCGATGNGGLQYRTNVGSGEVKLTIRQDLAVSPSDGIEVNYSSTPGYNSLATYIVYLNCRPYGSSQITFFANLSDSDGNVYTQQLAQVSTSCSDSMILRTLLRSNSDGTKTVLAYVNDALQLKYSWSPASIGEILYGPYTSFTLPWATGGRITNVDLGNLDSIAPNPIPSASINVSAYVNHVDLSWPAASDDANGTGVYDYEIYRNGSFMGSTTGLSFSDTTVNPSATYSYSINAVDYHGNSAPTTFNVTTPYIQTSGPFPSATPEGRRVGVRATGAYWGAGGENIDVLSGNLNFTLPLVKAQARSGWGVGFNLNYNSQNWRYDSGGNWKYGGDVGYGFGWRLLAGSITPVFSDPYTVSYYLFTDSTGAEYRLDQNSGNIWSSKESLYVSYDAGTSTLHFRDGSFWYFGCTSAASEADSGVMYPTLMEDTNGNQILIRYQTAPGASWTNSSARITQIEDVRGGSYIPQRTYDFTYNTDSPPHLTGITNTIGSGEAYTFSYLAGQALYSPFNSQSFGTTAMLRQVTVNSISTYHQFTYDGSGELTQILLPYKGYLAYDYTTATYSSSRSYREVMHRYLSKDGSASTQYSFSHESSPGPDVHKFTVLDDPGGVGEKYWSFPTSGLAMGLVTQYQGRQLPGPVTKVQNDYTWTQDAVGNSYIGSATTTSDPGQSYAAAKMTNQAVDTHGNVIQVNTYDYGNLTTPLRTDNYTYLNNSAYTSRYIFNRVTSTPTATIAYDENTLGSPPSDYHEWDSTVQIVTARGNPTTVTSLAGTQTTTYNFAGGVVTASMNGVTVSASQTNATNYSAPSQITVGSLSTSMSYSSFLGLTNETDPNGAQVNLAYDAQARPSSATSPFGATTTTTYYDGAPPSVTSTVNGRWTKTTMDGLGRPIKIEAGDSATESVTDTEYDSCGCSPTGKMKRTSLPHAPGATQIWTTYTYDGIGRTLTASTVGSETQSTTSYNYQGNTVTVTDAAGKWKKYTMDALGELIQVNEPNPAGGSDYVTTYAYDSLGHLTSVNMPRPSGTQTRTFNYGNPPGAQLLSATNPENGTVTYTYNSDKTLATKTDAKNQRVLYTYDSYHRVVQIRRGTLDQYNNFTESTCERETYTYDTTAYGGTYTLGRLAAVQYTGGVYACSTTFTESYSYNPGGAVVDKRLQMTRPASSTMTLDAGYTYDNEGRVTATQYPSTWNGSAWVSGPRLGNTYDTMGRLQKLTDMPTQTDIISNATYNPSGQLLTMAGVGGAPSDTRTYNSIGQMTQLQSGSLNIQYAYSSTQNNGKITSETDVVSGEQVTYAYDSLNRLASANSSVSPGWGQSYTYDGFGNMTNQTVTQGTAPSLSVTYDPATNRQTGEGADANGNICGAPVYGCSVYYQYDVENRIVRVTGTTDQIAYGYAPGNKRVWRGAWTPTGFQSVDELTFWGANGQKLTTYGLSIFGSQLVATATGSNYYFGGKLIKNATGYVFPDRLGSIGKYFPYGQERPSATADGKEKFATYFRDSETGLDYANNRYHQPGMGRFMTPDRSPSSNASILPSNWNRYAYVGGDPVNKTDPRGLCSPDDDPPCYSTTGTGQADDNVSTSCSAALGMFGGFIPAELQAEFESQCGSGTTTTPTLQDSTGGGDPPPPPPPPPPALCGLNPVTGQNGIIPNASGTPGQLRPGVGGSGRFGASRGNRIHLGIDLAGIPGDSVFSSYGGTVTKVGFDATGYGNYVIVDIGHGYTELYGHLDDVDVTSGQVLAAGAVLGTVGQTGNASRLPTSEAHVHFEVRDNGVQVDPRNFLNSECPF